MKPRLIHPRHVTLYRRLETSSDPDFGNTGTITWDTPLQLSGQVRYRSYDRMVPTGAGNEPAGDGHVMFMSDEWVASGGVEGDELCLSPSTSRLVVLEIQPCSHYGGEAQMVKVIFARKRGS